MYFLAQASNYNFSKVCSDYGMISFLRIAMNTMTLLQIIVPILAIVGLISALIKLFSDPENKKYKNAIRNWLMAFFTFFLLPVFINITMGLLDNTFTIADCWKKARDLSNGTVEYVPVEGEKHKVKLN